MTENNRRWWRVVKILGWLAAIWALFVWLSAAFWICLARQMSSHY